MKRTALVAMALLLLSFRFSVAPAEAQSARTFVSGHGLDANPCSLASPCRTFAHAYAQTAAGGEIDVLDVAGYGQVTITGAISIVNDGVGTASILVPPGGNGITINAGASDAVSLRGLTLDGEGAGLTGILFNSGASLTVENCVIRHVTGDGIDFFSNGTSSLSTNALSVSNALTADNGGSGVVVQPTGSEAVSAVFNRIEADNNARTGIDLDASSGTGTIDATVSESVATGNVGADFNVSALSGRPATTMMLFHVVAADSNIGVSADGAEATIRVAQSMVTGNFDGWAATTSGTVQSYGDNYIDGNASNQTAPPLIAKK